MILLEETIRTLLEILKEGVALNEIPSLLAIIAIVYLLTKRR